MIFLLFLISHCFAQENFCESFCYCTSNTATCSGVPIFPDFEDYTWQKYIVIRSSTLREVPTLYHFPALVHVQFESCPYICADIDHARIINPNIFIYSDCATSAARPTTTATPWLISTTEQGQIPSPPTVTAPVTTPELDRPIEEPPTDSKECNCIISFVALGLSLFVLALICIIFSSFMYIKRKHSRQAQSIEMSGFENPIYNPTTTDV